MYETQKLKLLKNKDLHTIIEVEEEIVEIRKDTHELVRHCSFLTQMKHHLDDEIKGWKFAKTEEG
jgi:hypothetical protein